MRIGDTPGSGATGGTWKSPRSTGTGCCGAGVQRPPTAGQLLDVVVDRLGEVVLGEEEDLPVEDQVPDASKVLAMLLHPLLVIRFRGGSVFGLGHAGIEARIWPE